jgi:cytochrome c oxidase subunit 4
MSVHVEPVRTYVGVFLALMVFTALTVLAAAFDLGAMTGMTFMNDVVAMAIAIVKAILVVWFFMHVSHSTPLTRLVVVSAVLWLVFLVALTLADYNTRGLLGVPGK